MTDLQYRLPADHVLVLRVCKPDGSSSHGFVWPNEGEVTAPDWDPEPECGNGLHGWLWGSGDTSVASVDLRNDTLRWLVLEVRADQVVDLKGKVKFPACRVALCGAREDAVSIVQRHAPNGVRVIFGQASAGYYGTIQIRRWDGRRYRTVLGYVGEDGIEAGVKYRLDDAGKFVKTEDK